MITRWSQQNGYKDVLSISLPLVASMGSLTLMQFTDRVFLANYSADAIAAALPAGIASFTAVAFFIGVANYVNAFIAQYMGASGFERIGASVWQGIYFSVMAACLLALLYFVSETLFDFIGHSPHIQRLEVRYFNILILGAGLVVFASAMACFYTGRGLTRVVMVVHAIGAAVNIPLDYCLINGFGFFPELGIVGAALATVAASATIGGILSMLIFFNPENRLRYGVWKCRAFDKKLFGRLMRYGLPSGTQFFLEIFGITFFVQMVGRLGDLELAASTIVLSIESLSFLPMVGFHIGTATLVGQAIGRGRPDQGMYATISALHITMAYMVIVAIIFVVMPKPLLSLFKAHYLSTVEYEEIMNVGVILMRFVAVFCFFDALNLIFSGAIKGAGDTRFIMWTIGALSIGVMIIPMYLAVEIFQAGLYTTWALATFYICTLGIAFMVRYRQGKWKSMRVIEFQPIGVGRCSGPMDVESVSFYGKS